MAGRGGPPSELLMWVHRGKVGSCAEQQITQPMAWLTKLQAYHQQWLALAPVLDRHTLRLLTFTTYWPSFRSSKISDDCTVGSRRVSHQKRETNGLEHGRSARYNGFCSNCRDTLDARHIDSGNTNDSSNTTNIAHSSGYSSLQAGNLGSDGRWKIGCVLLASMH